MKNLTTKKKKMKEKNTYVIVIIQNVTDSCFVLLLFSSTFKSLQIKKHIDFTSQTTNNNKKFTPQFTPLNKNLCCSS